MHIWPHPVPQNIAPPHRFKRAQGASRPHCECPLKIQNFQPPLVAALPHRPSDGRLGQPGQMHVLRVGIACRFKRGSTISIASVCLPSRLSIRTSRCVARCQSGCAVRGARCAVRRSFSMASRCVKIAIGLMAKGQAKWDERMLNVPLL